MIDNPEAFIKQQEIMNEFFGLVDRIKDKSANLANDRKIPPLVNGKFNREGME
jgi:hypothetical protein